MILHIDLAVTSFSLEDLRQALTENQQVILKYNDAVIAHVVAVDEQGRPPRMLLGLLTGRIVMSDDFDDELPDEFWFGEDDTDEATH